MYRIGLLLIGLLALQRVLSVSCAGGESALLKQAEAGEMPAWERVEQQKLLGQANPYLDEYDSLDKWLHQHSGGVLYIKRLGDPQLVAKYQSPWREFPDGSFCITTRVENGHPLPLREHLRRYLEAQAKQETAQYMSACPLLCAGGRISPELRNQLRRLFWDSQAPHYPRVPQWLAARPPLKARLFPDGSIMMLGEPGSGVGLCRWEVDARMDEVEDASLYDERGTLLEQGKPDIWLPVCDRLERAALQQQGSLRLTPDKYMELRDEQSGKLLKLWDYDGRALPLDMKREERSMYFRWLRADQLSLLYTSQQELQPLRIPE